jgi:hypothetical protein
MAIAHSKLFNFHHFSREYSVAYSANDYQSDKQRHIDIKEAFLATGWTLLASFRGTGTVSNDGSRLPGPVVPGTDQWGTNYANLNRSPTSNPIWALLQCPAGMGTMQIVIGCDAANTGNDETNEFDMRWSPGGLFMASGGGADGTSAAYPTAPDQLIYDGTYHSGLTANYYEIHACWTVSPLAEQFYMFATNSFGICQFWGFAKLNNAHPGLVGGVVATYDQLNTTTAPTNNPASTQMASAAYSSALWKGVIDGTPRSLYLGGAGYASNLQANYIRPRPDKSLVVSPCDLYLNTLGVEDFIGTVPDLYWNPAGLYGKYIGDAVDGDMNWFSGGTLMIPWDKTQPQIRTR